MPELQKETPTKEHRPILALSGGGFRGYFQSVLLNKIESYVGEPLGEKFSLIAGTSIGGINALAIAAGIPTATLIDFFEKHGEAIFPTKRFNYGLFSSRYEASPLREALGKLFGDRRMRDLTSNTIIPSVNFTKGGPQVFKTPHHSSLFYDKELFLVDVALATSAAPTYFPIHRMECGDMVDGGLIANHPGLFALIEAEKFLDINRDQIKMLHIGTMSSGITTAGQDINSGYISQWGMGEKLIELTLSSQEKSTNFIIQFMLGDSYLSLDQPPSKEVSSSIGLDVADATARSLLKQCANEVFKQNASKLSTVGLTQGCKDG